MDEYHGSISKSTCLEVLSKKGKDGAFLIRDSETIRGALSLCVYKNNVVHTYRILKTHTGYYTLQVSHGTKETFFKTLQELIWFYRQSGRGLITPLRYPVKKNGRNPPAESGRNPPAASGRNPPAESKVLHDDTPDYENVGPSQDYVEVLPN